MPLKTLPMFSPIRVPLLVAAITVLFGILNHAGAEIKTTLVEYREGGAILEGLRSFDDALPGKRPAVLIVHDWMGVTEHTKAIAEDIARLGYVAFAADIYGKGIRPSDMQSAAAEAGKYNSDRSLLRKRATAALESLKQDPRTDAQQIAAIGFCCC
jgi:dienelactone hydrolase